MEKRTSLSVISNSAGKKTLLKWWYAFPAVLLAGGALLFLTGRAFIPELTQEIALAPAPEASVARIGEQAPYWELSDIRGRSVKLTDFGARPLVMTFWASWNAASVDQLHILEESARGLGGVADIVAVDSQEDSGATARFLERGGYTARIVLDEDGAVGQSYGIHTLPVSFFLKSGIIHARSAGVLSADQMRGAVEELVR